MNPTFSSHSMDSTDGLLRNLTIAIPTYNRPQKVSERIHELAVQCNSNHQIIIIDNASTNPPDYASIVASWTYACRIAIYVNCTNIGADANICRCFEYANSPYVWVLGDDDRVLPNAIETIEKSVKAHPDVIWFNFAAHGISKHLDRKSNLQLKGCSDLDQIDSFSNLLLISNNLYKLNHIADFFSQVMRFTFTHAAQLAMGFSLIGQSGQWMLMSESLVQWTDNDAPADRWEPFTVLFHLPLLSDLPALANGRSKFFQLLKLKYGSCYSIKELGEMSISQHEKKVTHLTPIQAYRIFLERCEIHTIASRLYMLVVWLKWLKRRKFSQVSEADLEISRIQAKRL